MKTIESILKSHAFFKHFPEDFLDDLSRCAKMKTYQAGEMIAKINHPANEFYLIREGHVAISLPVPNRTAQVLETIGEGEIFGWSWLFPPYVWMFQASAITPTQVLALDAKCLRDKCENNPALGYQVMKQFSKMMVERLQALRLRLLDVYG